MPAPTDISDWAIAAGRYMARILGLSEFAPLVRHTSIHLRSLDIVARIVATTRPAPSESCAPERQVPWRRPSEQPGDP
jgi:hypothetical protein